MDTRDSRLLIVSGGEQAETVRQEMKVGSEWGRAFDVWVLDSFITSSLFRANISLALGWLHSAG
jgi:hypothetical protein